MKKSFKLYIIIWIISIVTFNIISFVVPTAQIGSFWVGYTLITLMFIVQLICSYLFFKQDTKEKIFLNIPIITISYLALFVSIIVGSIFMAITNLPIWIAITISSLVTAFYLIAVISMKPAIDNIENTDKKVKVQTLFIKSLNIDAQTLKQKASNNEIISIAEKVCEAIRYSDPVSDESLASCENQITLKFKEFEKSVIENNTEVAEKTSNELIILINDRNQKCKLLK